MFIINSIFIRFFWKVKSGGEESLDRIEKIKRKQKIVLTEKEICWEANTAIFRLCLTPEILKSIQVNILIFSVVITHRTHLLLIIMKIISIYLSIVFSVSQTPNLRSGILLSFFCLFVCLPYVINWSTKFCIFFYCLNVLWSFFHYP